MNRIGRIVGVLAAPTVVFIAAVALVPGRWSLITHIYLVVVAGGALATLAAGLARALQPGEPSLFERGLRRTARPAERVRQLERLEREVAFGRQSAWDLHNRLCPTLRETAVRLLVTRRGVDLERQPERAAHMLGADAWALVRPDRKAPEHRHEPGVPAEALDRALTALEEL